MFLNSTVLKGLDLLEKVLITKHCRVKKSGVFVKGHKRLALLHMFALCFLFLKDSPNLFTVDLGLSYMLHKILFLLIFNMGTTIINY